MIKEKIKSLIQRIETSGFLKSILTLSSGVVIGQAINFVGMPVLSRLYTPAAIGDYTVITANANVISAVACLGMMMALLVPPKEEESANLCKLVTFSSLIITTACVIGLYLLKPVYRIVSTVDISYDVALAVLWLYILSNLTSNYCYAYVNRLKKYRAMFWNPIIQAGVNVIIGAVFGVLRLGFIGYTTAHILGFFASTIQLLANGNPYKKTSLEFHPFILIKEYKRFPLYQMPANLVSNLSNQLPIQIIESVYGADILGNYSMALKILSLPTSLLATPVNRVYFQEATQRYNNGEDIGEFSYKILETNIKIALIPISILMIFGKQIFGIFLGNQWIQAGLYASVLGMYQLMFFCSYCLSGYFVIIKKNNWNLVYSVALLVVNLCLLVFKYICHIDILFFILFNSISMTIIIIISLSVFFRYLGFDLKRFYGLVVKFVILPFVLCMLVNYCINLRFF